MRGLRVAGLGIVGVRISGFEGVGLLGFRFHNSRILPKQNLLSTKPEIPCNTWLGIIGNNVQLKPRHPKPKA